MIYITVYKNDILKQQIKDSQLRIIKLVQSHYQISFDLFDQLKILIKKRGFSIEYVDFLSNDVGGCIFGHQIFIKNNILDVNLKIMVLSHEIGHWMTRRKDIGIKQMYEGTKKFNLDFPIETIKTITATQEKCCINYEFELAAQVAGEKLVEFLIRRRM